MKIGLVSLVSSVHDQDRIDKTLVDFREGLDRYFEITEIGLDELARKEKYDLILVFIKSGGTENQFKEIYQQLPQPVYLLSTLLHNSLAASMEILSWIKINGGRGEILHGQIEDIKEKIEDLLKINQTWQKLAQARLGVIGEPSDWLIASEVDPEKVKAGWGIEIESIAMQELIDLYQQADVNKAKKISQAFATGAEGMVENSHEDIEAAARVYLALKEIVAKYNLTALTVRCFDLVTELNTTGCLALSQLNNEGIIAGCEGDVPATFTMLLAYYLTGKLSFMANPNMIDIEKNVVKFAHCTVPTNLTNRYILRSHFETGIGVGIQGEIPEGPVTIFKVGGKELNQYVIKSGELQENLNSPHACRTQIKIKVNGYLDYFLTNPIGNHHLIIPGDFSQVLNKFFSLSEHRFRFRF